MNTSRISVIAALACVAAWTAKSVAIGTAGGLDRSPLESPLFALGLLAFVTAVVFLGLSLSAGRHPAVRLLAAVGGVVLGVGLSMAIAQLVAAVQPADPSWVWSEINLWIGAAVLVALVLGPGRRQQARATSSPRTA